MELDQHSVDCSLPDELPDAVEALHRRVHVHDAPVLQGEIALPSPNVTSSTAAESPAAKSASLFDPEVVGLTGMPAPLAEAYSQSGRFFDLKIHSNLMHQSPSRRPDAAGDRIEAPGSSEPGEPMEVPGDRRAWRGVLKRR